MTSVKLHRPRRSLVSFLALLGLLLLLTSTACYGPHTVAYFDSTRTPSEREFNHDLDKRRVEYERCGAAGVARIETYSGWFDMLLSYITYSDPDRSVDIICAEEE